MSDRDHKKLHGWSQALVWVDTIDATRGLIPSVWGASATSASYSGPGVTNHQDDLVVAPIGADGSVDRLSADELLGMVILPLVAGHVAIVNLTVGGGL